MTTPASLDELLYYNEYGNSPPMTESTFFKKLCSEASVQRSEGSPRNSRESGKTAPKIPASRKTAGKAEALVRNTVRPN